MMQISVKSMVLLVFTQNDVMCPIMSEGHIISEAASLSKPTSFGADKHHCPNEKSHDFCRGLNSLVREMGLEPTRLWLDTGTSSLPVCRFQHSRKALAYYNRLIGFVNSNFFFSSRRAARKTMESKRARSMAKPPYIMGIRKRSFR